MDKFEQQIAEMADANGDVSSEDLMGLLLGAPESQGDSAQAQPGEPDAGKEGDAAAKDEPAKDAPAAEGAKDGASEDPAAAKDPAAEPQPVLLAKDGKHTIEYQKLVDARNEAANNKARADAAEAELTRLREQAAKAPAPAPAPAKEATQEPDAEDLFGDYSAESMQKGVNALVAKALAQNNAAWEAKLTPLQKAQAEQATAAYLTPIYSAHPDADSIVASQEYATWKAGLPKFEQRAIDAIQSGDNEGPHELVEVLDKYRAANPKTTPAPAAPAPAPAAPAPAPAASGKSPAQRAQEIIAKTPAKDPTSLTDIPAGTQAYTDEGEAVAQTDSVDLMFQMLSQGTPDKIEKMVSRLV